MTTKTASKTTTVSDTEFNDKAKPLTDKELAAIVVPEFERKFEKQQPKGPRTFTAKGPKADLAVKYLLHGGFTRDQIAVFVGCSNSRVGEVIWAMEAAGLKPTTVSRGAAARSAAEKAEAAKPVKMAADIADITKVS